VSRFAAREFARLICTMDPNAQAEVSESAPSEEARLLTIGVDPSLSSLKKVEDPTVDDVISIQVSQGAGSITGNNEHSTLIAVYRFFREVGCVFVRPGREGEYVPQKDSASLSVSLLETPAYRHRGICLEGSNSYENVVDMIDWAPKMGFNAYFTQLFRPAFAFTRWYQHDSNPSLTPSPISCRTIDSFVSDYEREIALRGLHHHRIGHGWASKILGFTSGAWHERNLDEDVIPERKDLIAIIGGERKLFRGSGIDTNLCYSDPVVQEMMSDEVLKYAKEHPDIRYVHFWLADQLNNQCECERCMQARTADQYVQILNRIDEKLTREGLDTKIVFLIYLDLLWSPEKERLSNPDRFIMMFAPIRRSYSVPMASDLGYEEIPYRRNGFRLPPQAGGSLPYLASWQKVFDGDSFIFDYHYMWDYINDPGAFECVRIMTKDVEDFRSLGLNGFMSCQNQRVWMPNGFGMNAMGNALWTGKDNFHPSAKAYFSAAYGEDGEGVSQLMENLSRLFDPEILRGEKPVKDSIAVENYRRIPLCIDEFMPVVRKNLESTEGVQLRSWQCLEFYLSLCRKTAATLLAASLADRKGMDEAWQVARKFACDNEIRFQKEFDVFEFLNIWENKILYRFRNNKELFVE